MELNWWEVMCLILASLVGFGGLSYVFFRLTVGWGMGLEKRQKT